MYLSLIFQIITRFLFDNESNLMVQVIFSSIICTINYSHKINIKNIQIIQRFNLKKL